MEVLYHFAGGDSLSSLSRHLIYLKNLINRLLEQDFSNFGNFSKWLSKVAKVPPSKMIQNRYGVKVMDGAGFVESSG